MGFYWTLPVPRFGFTRLPETAEEAAAESRTIRYQRERVRHYAEVDCQGQIVGEVAWMEEKPDRGGHFVRHYLENAYDLCRAKSATLLYVNFGERFGWRKHMELHALLHHAPVECVPVPPDPIEIGGERFDPVSHFQEWRRTLDNLRLTSGEKEDYAKQIVALIAPYLPPERSSPDYGAAARFLDERELRTTTGKPWSPDSLRMFVNKYVPDTTS